MARYEPHFAVEPEAFCKLGALAHLNLLVKSLLGRPPSGCSRALGYRAGLLENRETWGYLSSINMLSFTLSYDGSLPSAGNATRVPDKQKLRRAFHPQLRTWWETGPLAATLADIGSSLWQTFVVSRLAVDTGFTFLPVVARFLNVACELDILLLKPEEPGKFISNAGDLDNRLKLLFDALRVPASKDEIPSGDKPQTGESPHFFCLLEDDALITKVSIRADRLLVPLRGQHDIRLLVGVNLRATHLTNRNFPFGA